MPKVKQAKETTVQETRRTPHRRANARASACNAGEIISDERLVAVAKKGDGTAFDELRKRHGERLFRVAHRIIRHREDAEDAVQESFLSAYIHLNGFDGRAKLSTWLTRVAINAALMKLRKTRLSCEIPLANAVEGFELCREYQFRDYSPNPEELYEKEEHNAVLRDAISELRPSIRKVVELHQLQECPMNETAKALGISVTAAKARLFHARTALRKNKALLLKYGGARSDSHKKLFARKSCTRSFDP
jgi:RNA polymerase sigma factor (sigma-70 family)